MALYWSRVYWEWWWMVAIGQKGGMGSGKEGWVIGVH